MDSDLRFRAHHVFCLPFSNLEFPERGSKFSDILARIKRAVRTETDNTIEIIEGVDELCLACPNHLVHLLS
ncbi:hypothetical protein ACFLTS_04610 [Chloroflexota bacterium]